MRVLSFYEGLTELSFALENSVFKLPYTYAPNLFSTSFSKEKFYKDVFEIASRKLGVDMVECQVSAIGVLDAPKVPYDTNQSKCLLSILPDDHVFVAYEVLATRSDCSSYEPVGIYDDTDNMLANIELYPHLTYSDTHDVSIKDTFLRNILTQTLLKFKGSEIVLTGDRFSKFNVNKPLSYLLVLDIVRSAGMYTVKVDKENIFPHTLSIGVNADYDNLGTLVNSPGPSEILFETEVGTSQFVELEEDKLFILPLGLNDKARLLVKNQKGQLENTVFGGELGVIVDTRRKEKNYEFREVEVDAIIQALNRI
jgi:hypothetical protein